MSPIVFNTSHVGLVELLRPLTPLVPQEGIAHATPAQIVRAAQTRAVAAIPSGAVIPGLSPAEHTTLVRGLDPTCNIPLETTMDHFRAANGLLATGIVQVSAAIAAKDFYATSAPVLFFDDPPETLADRIDALQRIAPSLQPLVADPPIADREDPAALLAAVESLAAMAIQRSDRTLLNQLKPEEETVLRAIYYAHTLGNTMIALDEVLPAIAALAAAVNGQPPIAVSEAWLNRSIRDLPSEDFDRHVMHAIAAETPKGEAVCVGDLYVLFSDQPDNDRVWRRIKKKHPTTLRGRGDQVFHRYFAHALQTICGFPLGTRVTYTGARYQAMGIGPQHTRAPAWDPLSAEEAEREAWLNRRWDELELSVRAANWLSGAGFALIGEIYAVFPEADCWYADDQPVSDRILEQLRNGRPKGLGKKSAGEIAATLWNTCHMPLGTPVVKDGERYRLAHATS